MFQNSYTIVPVANGFLVTVPFEFPQGPASSELFRMQAKIMKQEFTKDSMLPDFEEESSEENFEKSREKNVFIFTSLAEALAFLNFKLG